jgi:hypothetical protein
MAEVDVDISLPFVEAEVILQVIELLRYAYMRGLGYAASLLK